MSIIYLDNAATTQVDKRVLNKMLPFFSEKYANPATKWTSSLSNEVDAEIEIARNNLANLIGANSEEIFFTSGGTESDNTALKGIAYANVEKGNEIISIKIEHEAVLKTLEALQKNGFKINFAPVDSMGFVDPEEIKKLITKKTILITIMHANNEIGTIEPIEEIGKIAKEYGIYFHTDAVQTIGHIPVDVNKLNIDILSLSGHKFYAPKGVGALYTRKGTKIQPLIEGGGQEAGLRSGTLNTTSIIGIGEAAKIIKNEMQKNEETIKNIRNRIWENIQKDIFQIKLNGPEIAKRLPGNLNFLAKGIRNEPLLVALNEKGIIASGGSACSASNKTPSHVLKAIGVNDEDLFSSVRLTVGKFNNENEVAIIVENLKKIIHKLREVSPFWTEVN